MKRVFDIILSFAALCIFSVPLLIIAILIKLTSPGSVIHWSDRVGRDNEIFKMPKFRTMRFDAPQVATHLMNDPDAYRVPFGTFLRKSSLDELPQLWSVLKGDMSIVGPRPALYNQNDLITLRTEKGVHRLVPGITGWAQINGRDDLSIPVKVEHDEYYLNHQSMRLDLKIIILTVWRVLRREGVKG